jgi:hypothetical protein
MQIFPTASPIKSVQRGVATLTSGSANVTVSAVDMSKTVVNNLGMYGNPSSYSGVIYNMKLMNATTIQIVCYTGAPTQFVSWELVEYV